VSPVFHVKHKADLPAHVSRETWERLLVYAGLVLRWNPQINLVGKGTQDTIWERHFADSLQLLAHLPQGATHGIDLGSGAGFPGMVLAIASDVTFHLVESDRRKAAFLREVAAATGASVHIHATRAEHLNIPVVDVLTARALAPIERILPLAVPLLKMDGAILLLKGEKAEAELTDAAGEWHMKVARTPSATDPRGVILRLTEVRRVHS
jgi:16S rRNA (guanine527-N7)-methyltransferase